MKEMNKLPNSLPIDQIVNGDSLNILKEFPDNSVDLICTDPPYGYNFMGKDWDKAVVTVPLWKECLVKLFPLLPNILCAMRISNKQNIIIIEGRP